MLSAQKKIKVQLFIQNILVYGIFTFFLRLDKKFIQSLVKNLKVSS